MWMRFGFRFGCSSLRTRRPATQPSVSNAIGGGQLLLSSSGCEEEVQFAEGLSFYCIVVGVSVLGV